MPVRIRFLAAALTIAFGLAAGSLMHRPAEAGQVIDAAPSSRRMPDGKEWTTTNLNVNTDPSYCYDDAERNCRRFGRLYTWESARRACPGLGAGWRLPTDDEWRQLAKQFGGVYEDAKDKGKAAYTALLTGGRSGFNALLGGGRVSDAEQYARLDAHGFYWTASETSPGTALFYNFGKGSAALYRGLQGQKHMAVSVRCIRE